MKLTKANKARLNANKSETETEIEAYKKQLIDTLLQMNIDPVPFEIVIRMTAETLRERDHVYRDYMNNEESDTVLHNWNDQTRACLSMLKLTPAAMIDGHNEKAV